MDVLDRIVKHKLTEIAAAKDTKPAAVLEEQLARASPVRDFVAALQSVDGVALIAEVKKASPSAGLLRADFDSVNIARTYQAHGAACLSVLTDQRFFQGRLDDLTNVRNALEVPVLRKEFILDRYQILESRVAGADCVLLIAECLNDQQMSDLYSFASELGMSALIEIHEQHNLDRVLRINPPLIGINNRNLRTLVTDLTHTTKLVDRIPNDIVVVSESGIRTHADVRRLQTHGVGAMLVGESLMRSDDIGRAVDTLLGRP